MPECLLQSKWSGSLRSICIRYLLLRNDIATKLATRNNKCLLSHSFRGAGVQVWLSQMLQSRFQPRQRSHSEVGPGKDLLLSSCGCRQLRLLESCSCSFLLSVSGGHAQILVLQPHPQRISQDSRLLPQSQQRRQSCSQADVTILGNFITHAMTHYFRHILWVRRQSQVSPTLKGRGHARTGTPGEGNHGSHLRVCPPCCPNQLPTSPWFK